jgi:hypothetical protein
MSKQALAEEDRVASALGGWRPWFALLGASVAWAVHFMVSYLLIEAFCASWGRSVFSGLSGVTLAVLLTTLLTLPVAVASGLVAWRNEQASAEGPDEVGAYIGRAGMLLSCLFALVIVVETIPALTLAPCQWQ